MRESPDSFVTRPSIFVHPSRKKRQIINILSGKRHLPSHPKVSKIIWKHLKCRIHNFIFQQPIKIEGVKRPKLAHYPHPNTANRGATRVGKLSTQLMYKKLCYQSGNSQDSCQSKHLSIGRSGPGSQQMLVCASSQFQRLAYYWIWLRLVNYKVLLVSVWKHGFAKYDYFV